MYRTAPLFMILLCIGCASPASPVEDEVSQSPDPCVVDSPATQLAYYATGCVATIDGVGVPPSAFNDWVRGRAMPRPGTGSVEAPAIEPEVLLDGFMHAHLLEYGATEDGFEVTPEQVDAEIAGIHGDVESFEGMVRQMGSEDVEERVAWWRRQVALMMYACQDDACVVSDDDLRAYYEQNVEKYTEPERVRARHILFKLDMDAPPEEEEAARARAAAVAAEARLPGADFGALAQAHSEGPTASMRGDLGFFSPGQMVEPFSDAAFSLAVGEVSDPVRTQFGWHVILVEEKLPSEKMPLESMRSAVTRDAQRARKAAVVGQALERVVARHEVKTMPENIKAGEAL